MITTFNEGVQKAFRMLKDHDYVTFRWKCNSPEITKEVADKIIKHFYHKDFYIYGEYTTAGNLYGYTISKKPFETPSPLYKLMKF